MPARSLTKKGYRLCNSSEDEKRKWLAWWEEQRSARLSVADICSNLHSLPNAPAGSTVRLWQRQNRRGDLLPHPPSRGGPHKLTPTEEKVVIGKAIRRIRAEKLVSGEVVRNFVQEAFNVTVSASFVSRLLHRWGFTSHVTRQARHTQVAPKYKTAIHTFLLQVRRKISELGNPLRPSRLVAMDETSFWEAGSILRTYGLVNG